jgi:hypothetical protein
MHPFHFVIDKKCNVLQAGAKLQRVLPKIQQGRSVWEDLQVVVPKACAFSKWTFDQVSSCSSMCFILRGRHHPVEVKGQFLRTW